MSTQTDVFFALKRIGHFNSNAIDWNKMVELVISDLGWNPDDSEVFLAAEDHLTACSEDGKLPEDVDIIYELLDILNEYEIQG